MQATLHSDGRLDIDPLHPDWTPDGEPQPDADVIQLPLT